MKTLSLWDPCSDVSVNIDDRTRSRHPVSAERHGRRFSLWIKTQWYEWTTGSKPRSIPRTSP